MNCTKQAGRTSLAVKRFLLALLAVSFLALGCGHTFVGFVSNPGGLRSVSGTVTIVQLGVINDGHGNLITFTGVTLIQNNTASTVNFCGDQRRQFPIDRFVRVDFTDGIFCSTLHAVTVGT
jgi:hypothetical protein